MVSVINIDISLSLLQKKHFHIKYLKLFLFLAVPLCKSQYISFLSKVGKKITCNADYIVH